MALLSRDLIQRFFLNECSAEEAGQVAAYLQEHPDVLEEYAGRKEWDQPASAHPVPGDLRAQMRAEVYVSTRQEASRMLPRVSRTLSRVSRTLPRMTRLAAAACIAALLAGAYFWTSRSHPGKDKALPAPIAATDRKIPARRRLINDGRQDKKIVLADGSTVKLGAGSELDYIEGDARTLQLKGQAQFEVAKDQLHPFTVSAGGLLTTVLGTVFRVRAFEGEPEVSVRLMAGKVDVRLVQSNTKGLIAALQPRLLKPGEELLFSRQQKTMAVRATPANGTLAGITTPSGGRMTSTADEWGFYNLPLPSIMETLQSAGSPDVQIVFSKKQLAGIRFTGTFNKTDSLSDILNTIATMSQLRFTQSGHVYKVEK